MCCASHQWRRPCEVIGAVRLRPRCTALSCSFQSQVADGIHHGNTTCLSLSLFTSPSTFTSWLGSNAKFCTCYPLYPLIYQPHVPTCTCINARTWINTQVHT